VAYSVGSVCWRMGGDCSPPLRAMVLGTPALQVKL
jgi:hypothetical protein